MRMSYPENGAKNNSWIGPLWGRTQTEVGSRIVEVQSLSALREALSKHFQYYSGRRHSLIGYVPAREHLKNARSTSESEPKIPAVNRN